jgi:hypothetical protein
MNKSVGQFSAAVAASLLTAVAAAQQTAVIDFESVGRAWPLEAPVTQGQQGRGFGGGGGGRGFGGGAPGGGGAGAPGAVPGGGRGAGGPGGGFGRGAGGAPQPSGPPQPPEGVVPLERDLFTSDDFYADRELWSDPRYFRCLTSTQIENLWGGNPGGGSLSAPDASFARWGDCNTDLPREGIVSPYPFATAQEHYEALLAETKSRGGPTEHTYATVPGEWTGIYAHPARTPNNRSWYNMSYNQVPTILSLLTEEYQTYKMQETYHHGHTNAAQWPSSYCWAEGFMRRWHQAAVWERYIMVTPDVVQILAGVARNFITTIHIGREFKMDGAVPYLSEQVPRWYGETIGFWDGDTLITWTSNIQGWIVHAAFEHSSAMQSIEIYTPNRDADGNFLGLNHETILYDPEALVEPVRIITNMAKQGDYNDADQPPYVFIECVQTIFPVDGRATPVTPGQVIEYKVPDMYDRPWARIWEEYFEQNMTRPEEEDIFSFD